MKKYKTAIKIFSFIIAITLFGYISAYAEVEPLELPVDSLSLDSPEAQSILDDAFSGINIVPGSLDYGAPGLAFNEALESIEYSTSSELGYYDPWASNTVDALPAYGDLLGELTAEMEDEVSDAGGGLRSIGNDKTAAELLRDIGLD